jgi:hypothetical protein
MTSGLFNILGLVSDTGCELTGWSNSEASCRVDNIDSSVIRGLPIISEQVANSQWSAPSDPIHVK